LSGAIAGLLKGLGHMNPFLVMLVVCLVTTAISEVASNTATASMLLPLLAVSAEHLGQPPAPLMFAATLAASFGFMLPAGTPPNAIVYSSGYIPVTQMARSGLAVDLFGAALIGTVCYFVAPWALGIR
jgi:sodium-dependent dicarboxylate transporter 2/3/5